MADRADNFIKLKSEPRASDETPSEAGSTPSNKPVSQTEEALGSYSYSTLDGLTPSATGIGPYAQGIATIVNRANDVIGVTEQLRSSLPDNPSPAGSSPLNSASDGSGGPPTSTSPGSANSTPGSNQPQDPTNGGGGASGGNGGGNGGPTSSPGDGPDDGPNRGNDQQNNASPADQRLSEVIGAIDQVTAAVINGSKIQGTQLVSLRLELITLTDAVKVSTEQLRPAAQLVEQLGAATEALTQAIEAQRDNGKQVDARLAKIAEEVTKLTEGLASIRIDDIVSGIETIRAQIESGSQINQNLLIELIAKAQASNGPVKLDETQLQTLTGAIATLEQGRTAQQTLNLNMGNRADTLMQLLLEGLEALRDQVKSQQQQPAPSPGGSGSKLDLRTTAQKRVILTLLDELDRDKDNNNMTFDAIKPCLDELFSELQNQGFLKNVTRDFSRMHFTVSYQDPDYPDSSNNPTQVTIANSSSKAYGARSQQYLSLGLSLGGMALGAASLAPLALGGAVILPGALSAATICVIAGLWGRLQYNQASVSFDESFSLNLDQKTNTALSPQKMFLESLSTYILIKGTPRFTKRLELFVKKSANNHADTSLTTLVTAMKNTIKFWDEFRLNIPNIPENWDGVSLTNGVGQKNVGDMANLRDREFDANIDRFKPWLPKIENAFLRRQQISAVITDVGTFAGVFTGLLNLL
jgi:hypothetical protein